MKKILALLLAAVMCFSLTACGGVSKSNEPALSDEWMSYLCGEWEYLNRRDEGKIETVTFYEDGTATIGSESGIWTIENHWEGYLRVDVSNEEKRICAFNLDLRDGDLEGEIIQYNGQNIPVYKPSYYEIISITAENWRDYFEEQIIWEEINNEFDELKYVKVGYDYVLKEQYFSRLSHQLVDDTGDENVIKNGAYEVSYECGTFVVQLDLDNDTYTIEVLETTETSSYVNGFGFVGGCLSFGGISHTVTPDSDGRHQFNNTEFSMKEVMRMQLDLYMIAE